jgi:hypothetical protein
LNNLVFFSFLNSNFSSPRTWKRSPWLKRCRWDPCGPHNYRQKEANNDEINQKIGLNTCQERYWSICNASLRYWNIKNRYYRGVPSVGPVHRTGRFFSGLRGRRRTYLTILKKTWSANFKMVWYIFLRPLRPEQNRSEKRTGPTDQTPRWKLKKVNLKKTYFPNCQKMLRIFSK